MRMAASSPRSATFARRVAMVPRAASGPVSCCALLVLLALLPTPSPASASPPSGLGAATAAPSRAPVRALGVARSRPERALQSAIASTPSNTRPSWACPKGSCDAIIDPQPSRAARRWELPAQRQSLPGPSLEGGGELGGFDPTDLQAAYQIPSTGGSGQTIALVEAYGYSAAEEDLAKYRERYGLGACTKADGCLRKVNDKGEEANYPAAETGWDVESALDVDMASAACPSCHILLVEAASDNALELALAAREAASLGATEISNSYSIPEQICPVEANCEELDSYYDHPGVIVTASAGDSGYDNYLEGGQSPGFPAASPYVVAVGGTSLRKTDTARGWSEEVWSEPEREVGTGSGCSGSEPKPIWQLDSGCLTRTDNDVAAVAACDTPVSIYTSAHSGWTDVCGTSASAPLVAGIEAHASEYARSLPGADAFYQSAAALFDVTAGSNEGPRGECVPPAEDEYLCHAEVGYDAPTGNGTPDGPLGYSGAPPTVATQPASAATGTGATLNGTIEPQGLETTYQFEYGTTASYGSYAPVPDAAAGAGTANVAASTAITGLQADTTYHYRLLASNSAGVSRGADRSFSTGLPTVSEVQPREGPGDGGTTVTVTGSDFAGTIAVRFGASAAKSFTVENETTLTAVSPPGSGPVDVTVSTAAGTSATSSADRFAYAFGPVAAWGANGGRLGDGSAAISDFPVEMGGVPEAVALSAGDASLALLKDGTVMAAGINEIGEVGDGTQEPRYTPVHVCAPGVSACPSGPYLQEVASVAAGAFHSLALLRDGTVMSWGSNIDGELGVGTDATNSDVPVPVCTVAESPCQPEHYLSEVVAIAAGGWHSLALLKNGTVMAWGSNYKGQLGDGAFGGPERCDDEFIACSRVPIAIGTLKEVTAIAAGTEQSLALLKDGTVMAWGENGEGDLGDGTIQASAAPVGVCAAGEVAPCTHPLTEVAAIAAGWSYSVALLKNGTVKTWGENYEGELGDGTTRGPQLCSGSPCSETPVAVKDLSGVVSIAAGESATDTLALRADGTVMAWGSNERGELGDGKVGGPSSVPVGVCMPGASVPCPHGPYLGGEVSAMAVGADHDLVSIRPIPSVSAIAPSEGPRSGGTAVTIYGANFTGEVAVAFGGVQASEVHVDSPDELTAVSPAGTGTIDVTVSTAEGPSASVPADRFAYESPPEYGRCVKVTSGSGRYGNASCTALGGKDRYEWSAGASEPALTLAGATARLETVGGTEMTCKSASGSGVYASTSSLAGISLALTGCESDGSTCSSAGAAVGEARSQTLAGELQWQDRSAGAVVLDLFPAEGTEVLTVECAGERLEVGGSVLVPVKTDKMTAVEKLRYEASGGRQLASEYETAAGSNVEDVLEASLAGGPFEAAGLTLTLTLHSAQAIEANAIV